MRPRTFYALFTVPGNVVLVALFLLPMVLVAVYSFGTVDIVGLPKLGFTLDNYDQATQSYYVPTIVRTVEYAAATTILCLLIGYPLAYLAARHAGGLGRAMIAVLVCTWIVDYLVRIYAWTAILDDQGVVNDVIAAVGFDRQTLVPSTGAVILGLVYGYFPLMVLPIYAALGDLDPSLIEAGKDLYGTPRQTFWHVTWPASLPGVLGGVILTFFPALGDFATAQFLGGPDQAMIGNLINQQFTNSGLIPFGAALTMVLIGLVLIGVVIGIVLSRGRLRQAARGLAAVDG